jgi:glucose dehydrogenase
VTPGASRWGAIAAATLLLSGAQRAQEPAGEWRHYAADERPTRYSPLDQINQGTVGRLRVAWRGPHADPALTAANPTARPSNRYTATLIMTGGTLYVPEPESPTLGTLQLPGANGGAAWTGAAFDPERQVLFVPSKTNPFAADLVAGQESDTDLRYRAGTRSLVGGPRGLPLVKPPYGRVTAIDLRSGDHLWVAANGDGPRFHPELAALRLPPLGRRCAAASWPRAPCCS